MSKLPNKKAEYSAHFNRTERYASALKSVMETMASELAALAVSTGYNGATLFSWSDFPATSKQLSTLETRLHRDMFALISNSVKAEWGSAELFSSEYARKALGIYGVELEPILDADGVATGDYVIPDKYKAYFRNNNAALSAFLKRKDKGLDLSKKVWNLTAQHRAEMELAISLALEQGVSAQELSRSIRMHLNEPEKLFRRVRDKFGSLVLSKAAKSYNPGAGHYRSSYKNAMRVARTEINYAYRSADMGKMNDFDFVVGFKVSRSNNPYPCKVCAALVGKYPKDFTFTGWHPHCRCYLTFILKSTSEFLSDSSTSKNEVKQPNAGFTDFVKSNKERIEAATKRGTLPYFLKDNKGYIPA